MPGTVSQFALASYGADDQTMPVPALLPSADTDKNAPGIPSGTATALCDAGVGFSLPPSSLNAIKCASSGQI